MQITAKLISVSSPSPSWAGANANCTNQNRRLTQFERKSWPAGTPYRLRAAFSIANSNPPAEENSRERKIHCKLKRLEGKLIINKVRMMTYTRLTFASRKCVTDEVSSVQLLLCNASFAYRIPETVNGLYIHHNHHHHHHWFNPIVAMLILASYWRNARLTFMTIETQLDWFNRLSNRFPFRHFHRLSWWMQVFPYRSFGIFARASKCTPDDMSIFCMKKMGMNSLEIWSMTDSRTDSQEIRQQRSEWKKNVHDIAHNVLSDNLYLQFISFLFDSVFFSPFTFSMKQIIIIINKTHRIRRYRFERAIKIIKFTETTNKWRK